MDATFGFCFALFGSWKTHESSLSFETISKPFGFIAYKLESFIAELNTAIFWNWYGVFGVTDAWISLSVKRMMWYFIVLYIIKDILQTPVNNWVTIS